MTNHVRLYVLVKLLRYEPCRPYRPEPIMAAKVPFNHGQSVVDVDVRPEGSQPLNNTGDANSAPHAEEIVGVLVLCPLPKCKCLKHGKSAQSAYRNLPGNPCGRMECGRL